MISQAFTVDGTAVKLVAADDIYRDIYLHVTGNGTVYLGGSGVTSTNGLATEKHAVPLHIALNTNEELWAICAEGVTENVRVMRPTLG